MKKMLKSFISFTRTERIGFICLCSALLVFIGIRISMQMWVHPKTDTLQEQKLAAEWETFKRTHTRDTTDSYDGGNAYTVTDTLYINTADSVALVNINGIGPVTAHRILTWRHEKGHFTSIDQVKDATHFDDESFERLADNVIILLK